MKSTAFVEGCNRRQPLTPLTMRVGPRHKDFVHEKPTRQILAQKKDHQSLTSRHHDQPSLPIITQHQKGCVRLTQKSGESLAARWVRPNRQISALKSEMSKLEAKNDGFHSYKKAGLLGILRFYKKRNSERSPAQPHASAHRRSRSHSADTTSDHPMADHLHIPEKTDTKQLPAEHCFASVAASRWKPIEPTKLEEITLRMRNWNQDESGPPNSTSLCKTGDQRLSEVPESKLS